MMAMSWRALLAMIVFCVVMTIPARATLYSQLSSLEIDLVEEGLAFFGVVPDENPHNKVVRTIYVITVAPFTEDSGFLTVFNWLHVNTRQDIVRREIIQKEGEVYDEAAVRDSELVLRSLALVRSTAVIVPVQKNDEESVETIDLLVVTRDLLSLRPTFNFKGSFDLVTNIMVALGEHNLLGYNKSVSVAYEMQQGAHLWSAHYFDPRIFGSPLQLTIKPTIIALREGFKYDGMMGELRIEKPLLSESDLFGYGVDLNYGTRSIIDFNGAHVRMLDVATLTGVEQVERKYRWQNGKGLLFTRFSFGRTHKREAFIRYGFNVKRPSLINDADWNEEKLASVRKNLLPKNEFESYITFGLSYFQNKFMTLYDYDNYKLQETKRTGLGFTLSNDFALTSPLMSDKDFLRPETKVSYLQALYKDSFVYGGVSTSNRYDGSFKDNTFKYGFTVVSPRIPYLGRLVFDGRLSTIDDNRDNQKFVLGSDSGVRGVESRAYSGDKGFRTNLELRSPPFDLWKFHLGGVLFYDVGAAFDKWSAANATHAIGIGFRFLAPQVSSVPFRFDIAFPIYGKGQHQHVVVPSFGTGQAF